LAGDFVQGGKQRAIRAEKNWTAAGGNSTASTAIAKEIEGEWKGGYELQGYPRKVTIKLQNRGPEGATAEFVIVGRKENKLPVDRVVQQGEFVTVDSHESGLSFEGRARKGRDPGNDFSGSARNSGDTPPR
jgi:hypothetical protein